MNNQQANALFQQSIALLQQGKAQEALKHLTKLDQAIPSNPGILYFTATGHSILGNKQKAIQIYERVLRLNPQFIEAYNNIALDLAYLGEHEKAIGFIDQALAIRPDFIEAIGNKGNCLMALGNFEAALKCFDSVLKLNSNNPVALANISEIYAHLGQLENAKSYAEKSLKLNPNDYKAHLSLGTILTTQDNFEAALQHYLKAHEHQPNNPDTLAALGSAYVNLGKYDLANHLFQQALKVSPEHGRTRLFLGLMHQDLGAYDQSVIHLSASVQDKHRESQRKYNRALSYLHNQNFEMGWADYAWRWKEFGTLASPLITKNILWDGTQTDEPVLIWNEQGIGEQILFSSLLAEASGKAPNLIVRLDKRLVPIFKRSFPTISFRGSDSSVLDSEFKYHLPIADLGRIFRTHLANFDIQPPSYLKSDPVFATKLGELLSHDKPVCGLAWSTTGLRSRNRNLPLDEVVLAIQRGTPTQLVDLQYSDTSLARARIFQNSGIEIRHLDEVDNFHDLHGLASLISACDFVVTCSNSTAHLAGALGKETFLLVPFGRGRHWYWSHLREDGKSMWYPSIRVIPQTVVGDWEGPLEILESCIKNRPKRV